MSGTRTITNSALLLATLLTGAAAHAGDYLPLNPGNVWVYRSDGPPPSRVWTVHIERTDIIDGRPYALLRGLPQGELWLRTGEDGKVYTFDRRARQESLYADFGAPEGASFETHVDPCNSQATLASRSADYRGPIGEFRHALRVQYHPGQCADAGVEEDFYLPYVGLVRRTMSTIAGPRGFDLIYARLGGVTVVSEKEVAFQLSLDRPVYTANLMPPVEPSRAVPEMTARITVRNTHPEPLTLQFPTGQTYDLVIRNEAGETVYRWSAGQFFTQAIRTVEVQGEQNFVVTVLLGDRSAGKPLPEGKYVAEAWLTTFEPAGFRASVGFEIRHVH